ncbi:hypothetical protein FRB99_008874 [Tulasnella sp. 403]|nr:hypothetical protein FRB99_008874 [Tulasnella sp. 403]
MLFHQLTTVAASAGVEDWEIDRVKREVWEVGPSRLGLCFDVCPSSEGDPKGKWEVGMGDVMLQVARRVEGARERVRRGGKAVKPEDEDETWRRPPSSKLVALVENWQKTDYKKDSPLQKILKQRLRTAVLDIVKEQALEGALETPVVGERIARLVVFHAKVYWRLYEAEEFVDTDSCIAGP